jgi:C-terminal processing protease CtpA/Prc
VILDVRPNGGGDEVMAQELAGCFITKPKVYSKNTIRRDGKFTGPYDRTVEPNKARPAFRGDVVVLMGPKNVSSNESFLLMMRQVSGCKLIGVKSYGSSGCPRPVNLGNGVKAFVPSWVDMLPDGTELEGKGVAPDITVKATPADLETSDPVLDEGLKQLRGSR